MSYRMPEVTVKGWPLHLMRAELDLLAGDVVAAMLAVERLEDSQYNDEELWMWLAEIGAAADLWSGRAQSARDRVDRAMAADRVLADGRARRQDAGFRRLGGRRSGRRRSRTRP